MFRTGAVGIANKINTVLVSGWDENDTIDKTPVIAGIWQMQEQLSEWLSPELEGEFWWLPSNPQSNVEHWSVLLPFRQLISPHQIIDAMITTPRMIEIGEIALFMVIIIYYNIIKNVFQNSIITRMTKLLLSYRNT